MSEQSIIERLEALEETVDALETAVADLRERIEGTEYEALVDRVTDLEEAVGVETE